MSAVRQQPLTEQQTDNQERETDRKTDHASAQKETQLLAGVTASVFEIVADRRYCADSFVIGRLTWEVQYELAGARTDFTHGAHKVFLSCRIQILLMEWRRIQRVEELPQLS